ncbi:MAG: SGNH/GDSL hydrolase family protein [Candidatus Limnocylindrales bacterium]
MARLPTVLCFGDSNTHGADPAGGERFARDVRWPGVMAGLLAGEAHVIEEGLNGRTTIWDDPFTEGRNGRTYLLPCLRSHQPLDVLVLMLGTNDVKPMFHAEPFEVALGMQSLVDIAQASGCGPGGAAPQILVVAPPQLLGTTAQSDLWGFRDRQAAALELAPLYQAVAASRGTAFLDAGSIVSADPADGVHLSAGSHAVLARAMADAVRPLLPTR